MNEMDVQPDPELSTAIGTVGDLLDAHDATEEGSALEAASTGWGHYNGLPPQVALLADGRTGRLLAPLSYYRPEGSAWPVPTGAALDGASIPRAFWSIIGGPFEGQYRDASIVHDHYCVTRERSWSDTHHMFYDAMRCSGVGQARAGVMFYAVYRFGPRWPTPGLESLAMPATSALPSGSDAATLVRDAEAIIAHGLGQREIAALAEARERKAAAGGGLESLGRRGPADPVLLVVAGGSGTADDVAAVATRVAALPRYVVDHFFDSKIRIIACRNSVTDFERDLRGIVPRGWEKTGRTWDSVPGSYFDDRKRVVIGTVARPADGARVVPDKTTGLHGSDDLVVHESLHGYDYSLDHKLLAEPSFLTARNRDLPGLSDYERQEGAAGLEETLAETGAQHCVAPGSLAGRCPGLAGFWEAMPIATDDGGLPESTVGSVEEEVEPAIGTATREADGRLSLDLRATGPGGSIGHAMLEIGPDDPAHAALEQHLFPPVEGLESTGRRMVPFRG